ncbi:MAG TPA: gamma-glutamyltransferase [Casimicrobiaceae bacterium]|nr:gamma-glutamyltransferase [Casimicrobiaceae bacterium]
MTSARSVRRSRFLIAALASWSVLGLAQDEPPEVPSGWHDRKPVAARRFMVAAANPLAVDAGYAILRAGGSAVDAAIAVQLVLGLVEPQSSGLGGGGFMLVHDAMRNKLIAYDGRETAPAAAKPDRFLDGDGKPLSFFSAVIGGKSVGVPGTVALLAEVHKRHGRLPWAKLFAPAIDLAENGFPVSPRLNVLIAAEQRFVQPRARAYFYDFLGNPIPVGRTIRNPAYAATLRKIAAGGAKTFYEGQIASDIVATVTTDPANPGDMTLADLAGYKVEIREPVCGNYRTYRVCGMPLPSSGGPTVLQILGMLERFDMKSMEPAGFWSVHFISEAGRLAYADRSVYMADPAFYTPPNGLLDRDYLLERSRSIRPDASLGRVQPGTPPARASLERVASGDSATPEFPSTSHMSIVDAEGNAVAMTATIEYGFGSHLMTESGFLLNNELTDFSFVPIADGEPVANRVDAGKRPRSSMSPTIVYDRSGKIYMITGSPGGPAIINYVVKALVAVLDWGLDPQAATALPNFGSRNGPTELEAGAWAEALEPKLRALGHQTRVIVQTSGTQAIVHTKDGWIGGADPRREGTVRGD